MICRASGCCNSPTQGSPYCESHDEATFTSAADLQEASAGVNGQRSPSVHPRSCEHVGADGSRCRGWKVKGERLCAGHLGRGVAANPAAYARGAEERLALWQKRGLHSVG